MGHHSVCTMVVRVETAHKGTKVLVAASGDPGGTRCAQFAEGFREVDLRPWKIRWKVRWHGGAPGRVLAAKLGNDLCREISHTRGLKKAKSSRELPLFNERHSPVSDV